MFVGSKKGGREVVQTGESRDLDSLKGSQSKYKDPVVDNNLTTSKNLDTFT